MTTRQRTDRVYKDLISVLHECQKKGWIKDGRALQTEIELIHAALMQAIPDDSTSEADISNQFE